MASTDAQPNARFAVAGNPRGSLGYRAVSHVPNMIGPGVHPLRIHTSCGFSIGSVHARAAHTAGQSMASTGGSSTRGGVA